MINTKKFDLLVVYTQRAARSASSVNSDTIRPFREESDNSPFNEAYAYFLKSCRRVGVKAAFTTSADITKSGDSFRSYWLYKNDEWQKINQACESSLIFDKFSPITPLQTQVREKLFSNPTIEPFNDPIIYSMFFDKLETYNNLKEFTMPTVAIYKKDEEGIEKALKRLKWLIQRHPKISDFSKKLVLKDRFGLGGKRIFAIDNENQIEAILKIVKKYKLTSFLIQPFVQFKNGYKYKNLNGYIDIRVIHINNNIEQVYLRIAPKGDFRCNEHLGGQLRYIPKSDLQHDIKQDCKKILKTLGIKSSLFALDFIISDSGNVYLMEGNCGPGLDWNLKLKKNEIEAKKFIRSLAKHISKRIEVKNNYDDNFVESATPVTRITI